MSSLWSVPLFAIAFALVPVGSARAVNIKQDVCVIAEVAVFPGSRVHVHCNAPLAGTTVQYLAISNGDRDDANRVLATALSAQSMRANLTVQFDLDDTSAASFGCQAADCRVPFGVYLSTPIIVVQQPGPGPTTVLLAPEPGSSLLGVVACAVLFAVARRRRD